MVQMGRTQVNLAYIKEVKRNYNTSSPESKEKTKNTASEVSVTY